MKSRIQVYVKKWSISVSDKVATCGSCFAQHIGRRMQANNFNFLDVEPPPHFVEPRDYVKNGYSIYSARYGNVYTSTQLLQLFKRAFGLFQCSETWSKTTDVGEVRFVDPFRPNLNPAGWGSGDEVLVEQVQHLSACRRLFSELDVLVFTMGLTECWYSKSTGAVYPIAPGVNGGVFDSEVHAFNNLTFQEVMDDMASFIEHLREVNPKARLLLTVSPVPLTATAEDQHVLVASMHSKSVLRAVAGELARRFDFVDYFPSYEIVASVPFKGLFFQANLRTVHEEGVDFVMSHFFSQHSVDTRLLENTEVDSEEFCDEVFLDLARLSNGGQSAAV